MTSVWTLASVLALVLALVLTGVVRKFALSMRVIDVPNLRSSHTAPMPRGGGLATVIATNLVLAGLTWQGYVGLDVFMALSVGGVAIAAVGFLDDRQALPARWRFSVHVAAAVWALAWLGGLPPLQFGDEVFVFTWGGYILGILGIVWTLNLFNFMDGIDGLAASEAAFISVAGAFIHYFTGGAVGLAIVATVFAGACLGFLVWNWPPAKIFMGDVGSGYMGYFIAVIALVAGRESTVALLVWVTLGGIFFIDATVTLVRRVMRRESFHQAHRSHAYQWLSRRWASHRRVTVAVIGMNGVWLLPCAILASHYPSNAGWIAFGALVPVIASVILIGAGRKEIPTD